GQAVCKCRPLRQRHSTNCVHIQLYVGQCTKTPEPQNRRRCNRPFPDCNQHSNLPVGNLRRSVLHAERTQGIPAPYYEVVQGVHRLLYSVPSPCRQKKDSRGRLDQNLQQIQECTNHVCT